MVKNIMTAAQDVAGKLQDSDFMKKLQQMQEAGANADPNEFMPLEVQATPEEKVEQSTKKAKVNKKVKEVTAGPVANSFNPGEFISTDCDI